jgi:hypothetical protein
MDDALSTDILRTTKKAVEDEARTVVQKGREHDQQCPEIRYAGKSFTSAWHPGGGTPAHFQRIRIGPRGTRWRRRRNVLYVRRIAPGIVARTQPEGGTLNAQQRQSQSKRD